MTVKLVGCGISGQGTHFQSGASPSFGFFDERINESFADFLAAPVRFDKHIFDFRHVGFFPGGKAVEIAADVSDQGATLLRDQDDARRVNNCR